MESLELMRRFIKVAEVANKTSVLPQTSSNCNTSGCVDENITIKPVSNSSSQNLSQSTAVTCTLEVDLSQNEMKITGEILSN